MGANDSFADYVPPPEPAADYGDFSDSDFEAFRGNGGGSTRREPGGGGRGGNKYSNFNRGSDELQELSLIHISEPTRLHKVSRMPSSA